MLVQDTGQIKLTDPGHLPTHIAQISLNIIDHYESLNPIDLSLWMLPQHSEDPTEGKIDMKKSIISIALRHGFDDSMRVCC